MRKMKDSGIEWIGDIPEDWGIKKFKIIFSFGRGLSITKENLVSCGIPVINYGQIHAKENIGTTLKECLLRFVPEYFLDESKDSLLCYGDIVFADTSEDYAGVGNNVFIDVRFKIFSGYHTIICRPKISDCTKYIAYLLQTDFWRNQVRKNVSGIKVFSITQKSLRDTFILLPPLPEQQRIADYLDAKCARIDETAELVRQSMERLRAYKLSLITEAVTKGLDPDVPMKDSGISWIGEIPKGWNLTRLKYIGVASNGIIFSPEDVSNDGVFVLRSNNIKDGKLDMDNVICIDKMIDEKMYIKKGDILICSRNGSRNLIGKNCVIEDDLYNVSYGAFMMVFRTKNILCHYTFKSALFSFYIGTFLTSTINQLTISNFYNMKIPVPPIAEQQRIADYLDDKCARIDAVLEEKERLLERLAEYKKSLIFECVTGKREVSA